MEDARSLLRNARDGAGLSTRALATRAQVSPSTITRIEAGRVDPTAGMLRRLLEATGRQLQLEAPPATPALRDLSDAWTSTSGAPRPDWTRIRAFLDHLALHPERTIAAIALPPPSTGSEKIDALLAGIADKIADDAGLPRPTWAGSAPVLDRLWQSPGTPRMQAAALRRTPPQLLARNVVVAEQSLWRDRQTVGL